MHCALCRVEHCNAMCRGCALCRVVMYQQGLCMLVHCTLCRVVHCNALCRVVHLKAMCRGCALCKVVHGAGLCTVHCAGLSTAMQCNVQGVCTVQGCDVPAGGHTPSLSRPVGAKSEY